MTPLEFPPIDFDALLVRMSGSNYFSPELDVISVSAEGPDEFEVRWIHELQHFLFHYSTPYGQIVDEIAFVKRMLMQEYLENSEGKVVYPVYKFACEYAKNPQEFSATPHRAALEELIERDVKPWSYCGFLRNVLEGGTFGTVLRATAREGMGAVHLWESLLQERLSYESVFPNEAHPMARQLSPVDDSAMPACPKAAWGDERSEIAIGASFAAEAVAQFIEGGAPEGSDVAASPYLYLFARLFNALGLDEELDADQYVALTSTLQSIAELSLYTPLGLVYGSLRPESATWADIHPGYRLARCMDAVIEDGLIEDLSGSDDLQDDLCDQFGWVRPGVFREKAAAIRWKPFDRHRAAMQLRREGPHIFLAEDEDLVDTIHEFFRSDPPLVLANGKIATEQSRDDPRFVAKLVNHYLAAFSYFIMNKEGEIDPVSFFPSRFTGRARLLKSLQERFPWLRPDRFVPLRSWQIRVT